MMKGQQQYPPWVVFHIPHDSTVIPSDIRHQFDISDDALVQEVNAMTDHFTADLFQVSRDDPNAVYAPVSRLVVDVERFREDEDEPMAQIGMGAVYAVTSQLERLRHPLTSSERECLLNRFYDPHHSALETAVARTIDTHGRCLLIDCHSYPRQPLMYESAAKLPLVRPEICIGTDPYHTPDNFAHALLRAFSEEGFDTQLNTPFSGTLVPPSRYRRDRRLLSVMIEVRRDLYLNEDDSEPTSEFQSISDRLRSVLCRAIHQLLLPELS